MPSHEDDPFACFGDDDDNDFDDDDIDDVHSSSGGDGDGVGVVVSVGVGVGVDGITDDSDRERALRLMETYNTAKEDGDEDGRKNSNNNNPLSNAQSQTVQKYHLNIPSSNYEDQRLRTSVLPWPDVPPLYIGPMHLLEEKNKNSGINSMGRGYVANTDLPPGTCILIETPLISGWSPSQFGKRLGFESVQYILERENANDVLKWMEELHPRKVKVDACSPCLFPLVLGVEHDHCDGDNEAADNKNRIMIDPIDKIQIVDMMLEIMITDVNDNDNNDNTTTATATTSTTTSTANKEHDYHQLQQHKVQSLVSYAAQHNVHNSNGSPINCIDIVRLLLTLRYNGFDSGLYLHFSMFNHGEDPNCIKFRPTVGDEGSAAAASTDYSEARTTRYIRKGEALTLHYLENPREVSHSTRRNLLWEQHRFDIGGDGNTYGQYLDDEACTPGYLLQDTTRGRYIFESEWIHGEFPSNTSVTIEAREHEDDGGGDTRTDHVVAAHDVTSNIEKTLDELEDILLDLRASSAREPSGKSSNMYRNKNGTSSTTSSSSSTTSYYFNQAAALELTIGELITTSASILGNNHHILLARCRRMHIDVVELVLLLARTTNSSSLLTERRSNELMIRFIQSAQQLLESQRRRLGCDHPDVARTYHDYCMGIQALLSHAPRRLLLLDVVVDDEAGEKTRKESNMKGGRSTTKTTTKTTRWTLDQWSKMEHYCRMEKKRIEELYPRDVEDILKSVQKTIE